MDIKIASKNQQNSELSRAQRDLAVLYEISNAMRTTLELDRILYIILTGVTSHRGLGFNRAILFQVNTKTRQLEPIMAIGPESGEHAKRIWDYIKTEDLEMDELIDEERFVPNAQDSLFFRSIEHLKIPLETNSVNLLADAYHLGNPMHVTEEKLANYSDDNLLKELNTKELVIMPLKAKDKVNGLIVADNIYTQKPITKEDMRLFMMLANQAGLAIENSRLYELVMHKSHTDTLTGLWNHGYFQNQLEYQISKSHTSGSPLSLLLIDIDNFKKLNDTYGHQYGDKILSHIAKILKESSRETDFVCRYGGEEFSIILTNTTPKQGHLFAERIRERIQDHEFPATPNKCLAPITVSIGLASLPGNASTKDELIHQADNALYASKNSGKNRVSIADAC